MIKFLLLFLLIPTYCIGQISYTEEVIFKNQKHVLKRKEIKQIKISDEERVTTSITVSDKGIISEVNEFCYNSTNLSYKAKYDDNGNKIYSAAFDYECKGKIRTETLYIYDDTLLVELKIKPKNAIYSTSSKRVYDSLGRIIKYLSNSGLYDTFGYWEEYTYPNDSTRIELRINRDSTLIYKKVSSLNENGQELISSSFYGGRKTYWSEHSYNNLFQLTREAGYFYPSKKLSTEKRITYDKFGKILREDYEYSKGKNYEIYRYNNEGLLIELIRHDEFGERSTKYEYIN